MKISPFLSNCLKHPIRTFFGVIGLCFLLFIMGNNLYHVTKVKDINDPRFDPMSYRFEDYTDSGESQKVLKHIFPVGTPREKVENLLVTKLGATTHDLYPDIKSKYGGDHRIVSYGVPYNPLFCEGPPWKGVLMWPFYVGGRIIWLDYDGNGNLFEFISVMVP